MLHISLSAEKIFSIGSFPVTNSLLSTWIVMAILIIFALSVNKSVSMVPSNLQSIAEMIISGLYSFFESVMGHHIKKSFAVIASLFFFIIVANWLGLLPGVGTIGFYEEVKTENLTHATPAVQETAPYSIEPAIEEVTDVHAVPTSNEEKIGVQSDKKTTEAVTSHSSKKFVPLLRGATADLNMTIALAIVAFFAIQYFGFATLGIHYSRRFFNFSNPIMFFVGLLEIVSDLSKVISFAFRLFGNIFAGEVLLAVIAFLMPFIAPMPFLMLELFVGFIQALVFSTLTAVFINVAVAHEE